MKNQSSTTTITGNFDGKLSQKVKDQVIKRSLFLQNNIRLNYGIIFSFFLKIYSHFPRQFLDCLDDIVFFRSLTYGETFSLFNFTWN